QRQETGRPRFGKNANGIDDFQCCEHSRPIVLGIHRAPCALELPDRGVAVQSDEEDIALLPRRLQVRHMADVQYVEATVGDDQFSAPCAQGASPGGQSVQRKDLVPRTHQSNGGPVFPGLATTKSVKTHETPPQYRLSMNRRFVLVVVLVLVLDIPSGLG